MKQILILLLWLPLAVGCKKNELNALPPATQTGANTFGCLVNGKAWVPGGKKLFNDKPLEGAYIDTPFQQDCLWIQAVNKDGTGFNIFLKKVISIGEYPLDINIVAVYPTSINPSNYAYYYDGTGGFITTATHTGKVAITKADTVGKTVSGTFEFTGYNPKTRQTVSVTQGRFDVNHLK